jgi:pimeloyl-ACP methyl ester carboxylesterase
MAVIDIKEDNTVTLRDGRKLGFARYGNPADFPVLFFHGIPGSRMQRPLELDYLNDLSLCLYVIERPGIGLSTPLPYRSIRDFTDDVAEFCKLEGFGRAAFVGISGGSPYALAMVRYYPELVEGLTLISAMAPLSEKRNFRELPLRTQLLFSLAVKAPGLSRSITTLLMKLIGPRIDRLFPLLLTHLPESDKTLLTGNDAMSLFQRDVMQAIRNGSAQLIQEISLLLSPWHFDPAEIRSRVHVWHGQQDSILPYNLARELITRLPEPEPHIFPDKGHFFALEEARHIFETIRSEIKQKKNLA